MLRKKPIKNLLALCGTFLLITMAAFADETPKDRSVGTQIIEEIEAELTDEDKDLLESLENLDPQDVLQSMKDLEIPMKMEKEEDNRTLKEKGETVVRSVTTNFKQLFDMMWSNSSINIIIIVVLCLILKIYQKTHPKIEEDDYIDREGR